MIYSLDSTNLIVKQSNMTQEEEELILLGESRQFIYSSGIFQLTRNNKIDKRV